MLRPLIRKEMGDKLFLTFELFSQMQNPTVYLLISG